MGTTTRSAYDGLQRLTGAAETPGTTYAYTYDLAGNRTEVRENGALVANLSYNDANQVIGWSYDAAGNLLSDGATTRSYDALNRLVAQDSTSYTYNGDGVLVSDGTTTYAQDLAAPLSQVLSDGTDTYVYGQERLRALGGPWYVGDALGSVRQTLDDAGGVLGNVQYDPWGTPQDTLSAPFGFTGELHSAGQVYLRARWYAPGNGTFTSRDPFAGFAEMPYSLHAYQYAYSNPVRWTDPSGEVIPWCPIGYKRITREDGSFGGCEKTGKVPQWVSDISLTLPGPLLVGPAPGAAGPLGGKTLPQLGKAGVEACTNLIGGTLAWVLTQIQVDTQTRRDDNREKLIYYHYGTASKVAFIVTTKTIPFSDASANPKRARYGSGVYFTDIAPGSISKAQIARALYGNPFPSTQKSVEAWGAVDLKGLQVTNPRNHVYLVQTTADFPISGRLINSGATP